MESTPPIAAAHDGQSLKTPHAAANRPPAAAAVRRIAETGKLTLKRVRRWVCEVRVRLEREDHRQTRRLLDTYGLTSAAELYRALVREKYAAIFNETPPAFDGATTNDAGELPPLPPVPPLPRVA